MSILVLNCGSSSIKAALFDEHTLGRILDIRVAEIGTATSRLQVDKCVSSISAGDHGQALDIVFESLRKSGCRLSEISTVGHRVIHGGEQFLRPTVVNDEVEFAIDAVSALAPLHNQICLAGIRAARKALPQCIQVAIFDTGFHATLPTRAKLYALPADVTSANNIRRFGFHGISHEYVTQLAAQAVKKPISQLRIISCHLGNGCSVAAVENGRSVETSMGMTPLEGLVMGTRSGDLDPGVIIQLLRGEVHSPNELELMLNHKSGLLGMAGTSDMSDIENRAAEGNESSRQTIQVFTHRVRKYIGAYAAVMGGVDMIIFTGGIGENSALIRHRIVQRFDFLGAQLDEDRNRNAMVSLMSPLELISADSSRVKLAVIATDEEKSIAASTILALAPEKATLRPPPVPIAVSARNVHLDNATLYALFGDGYTLTPDYPLSQPGQFVARETVTLVGPRNRIDNVRVLCPTRSDNQIEISRSDEFFLGIDAPVRASGDTDNTPGITLIGSAGRITLERGVICALRHIHMHEDDAKNYQVTDGDLVDVAIDKANQDLIFRDVLVRVSKDFKLEMHIDTDEANAAGVEFEATGTLVLRQKNEVLGGIRNNNWSAT